MLTDMHMLKQMCMLREVKDKDIGLYMTCVLAV